MEEFESGEMMDPGSPLSPTSISGEDLNLSRLLDDWTQPTQPISPISPISPTSPVFNSFSQLNLSTISSPVNSPAPSPIFQSTTSHRSFSVSPLSAPVSTRRIPFSRSLTSLPSSLSTVSPNTSPLFPQRPYLHSSLPSSPTPSRGQLRPSLSSPLLSRSPLIPTLSPSQSSSSVSSSRSSSPYSDTTSSPSSSWSTPGSLRTFQFTSPTSIPSSPQVSPRSSAPVSSPSFSTLPAPSPIQAIGDYAVVIVPVYVSAPPPAEGNRFNEREKATKNRDGKCASKNRDGKYACEQPGCNKAFSSKFSLKRHKKTHTSDKPYVCNVCQHRCREKSGLKRHSLKHTGEKPWACNGCTKRFADKVNMNRHISIEHPHLMAM